MIDPWKGRALSPREEGEIAAPKGASDWRSIGNYYFISVRKMIGCGICHLSVKGPYKILRFYSIICC